MSGHTKGPLPDGAIAWLDMGKGEAELTFSKRGESNRASKRRGSLLFQTVSPGFHPLYLRPNADALIGSLREIVDELDRIAKLGAAEEQQWPSSPMRDRAISAIREATGDTP